MSHYIDFLLEHSLFLKKFCVSNPASSTAGNTAPELSSSSGILSSSVQIHLRVPSMLLTAELRAMDGGGGWRGDKQH